VSRGGYGYLLFGLLTVAVVLASGEASIRSFSCKACHQPQADFAHWMTIQLGDKNKGFSHELIACADCHIEGSPQNTFLSRARSLLHVITYFVPQIDPRSGQTSGMFFRTRVPSSNCQYCHFAAIYRKAVYMKDLPKGLKEIGLVMDHRKHIVARDDTCAKCHERYNGKDKNRAEKEVNYAEVNHLACDSCHVYASHDYQSGHLIPMSDTQLVDARREAWNSLSKNPRWMVAFPLEKSCRRCHNGEIHYKTKIFRADCREGNNYDNCLKCHPIMTKEYFDNYLKERDSDKSSPKVLKEPLSSLSASINSSSSPQRLESVGQRYGRPTNKPELNFPNSTMNWSGGNANSKR